MRNLHQPEMSQMLQMFEFLGTPPTLEDDEEDELICTSSGGFNNRTCYKWLIQQLPATPNDVPFSCMWIQSVPPKVQFFMWTAVQNSIATTDNLLRRGCQIQNVTCSLCNAHSESVNHLLLHCKYSHKV